MSQIIECPVCQEQKNSYVKLECKHSICLKCYHNCIYHNHIKCSLCRASIKELEETCELIHDLETDVEDLEKMVDGLKEENEDLQEIINETQNRNEYLEERISECDIYHR
jgi:predicted nuclease with TOPRIM domain